MSRGESKTQCISQGIGIERTDLKLHEIATIRTVAKGGIAPCGSIVLSPFSLNVSYQEKDSILESDRYVLIPDSSKVDSFFLLKLLQEKKIPHRIFEGRNDNQTNS